MESTLNEMWCCPITHDAELVAEIQSQIQVKYDVRLRLDGVPSVFPGFVGKLLKNVDVTQEEIDNAWFDAAIDLLGRPAIRHTSHIDHHMLYADMERQHDGHHMSNIWPGDQVASQHAFAGRPAIRHTSMIDSHMLYTDMEDSFELIQHDGQRVSNIWPSDQEASRQAFTSRPASRRTSMIDSHMFYAGTEDPIELTQHDGQLMSNIGPNYQEGIFANVERKIEPAQIYNHDLLM
jgi:hypothetical protein